MTRTLVARSLVARSLVSGRGTGNPSPAETPAAPVFSNINASPIMQTQATINWSIDQPATGQVNWGTTASYGNSTTEETSFNYSTHAQVISGLSPSTTYHYRVRSTNVHDQETVSGDHTFTTTAAEDEYPPDQTGVTFVSMPSVTSVPQYLIPQADGMGFGTVVTRVSNVANTRPRYPPLAAWNSDGSRLQLAYNDNGVYLNGNTYELIRQDGSLGNYVGMADPRYNYMAWSGNNYFQRRDVLNNGSWGAIKTFSEYPNQSGYGISLDTHAGQSWDDRYWPMNGRLANGQWHAFVWDMDTDTKGPTVNVPVGGQQSLPSRCFVSASGTYAMITTGSTQVMNVYQRSTMTWLYQLNNTIGSFPHNDTGKDINGDDCLVAVGSIGKNATNYITMVRLADGWVTHYFNSATSGSWNHTGYVSCKAIHMNGNLSGGWAFLSDGSAQNASGNPPGYGQVIALRLDVAGTNGGVIANPTVKVYGCDQRGVYSGSPAAPPDINQVAATPNPDGTAVCIGSNWRAGTGAAVYSYILAMP